jgi:hypothetical protein
MAFRPKEQAERELAVYLPLFVEAITEASRQFWKRGDNHKLDPGTQTRALRDYVVYELRRVMDGKSKVKIIDENQTTFFCADQNWIIQVHKLDEGNEVAKNFNQTSMDLRSNKVPQETTLPNLPATATVVFLGHVPNIADPKCPDMRLFCPGPVGESWVIPLGIVPPEQSPEITPKTPPPEGPNEGTRVVAKDQSADRKRDNN